MAHDRHHAAVAPAAQPSGKYSALTDRTFGSRTVLSVFHLPARGRRRATWYAKTACKCGARATVIACQLVAGKSQACAKCAQLRHGLCKTPEWRAWSAAKSRCHTRTNNGFSNYGARGIVMCARWRRSFDTFLADMGTRPTPRYSLDRIDVNGNYEPNNCRWATAVEQARNHRNNVYLTARGETKLLVEWLDDLKIPRKRVTGRLRLGWSQEEALFGREAA